jgi:hypothetical protein
MVIRMHTPVVEFGETFFMKTLAACESEFLPILSNVYQAAFLFHFSILLSPRRGISNNFRLVTLAEPLSHVELESSPF